MGHASGNSVQSMSPTCETPSNKQEVVLSLMLLLVPEVGCLMDVRFVCTMAQPE